MVTALRLDRVKDRAALPKNGEIVWEKVRHRRGLAIGYRSTSGTWFARVFARGELHYPRLGSEAELPHAEALDKAEVEYRRLRGDSPIGYTTQQAAIEDYARTKIARTAQPETALVWDDLRVLTKHITGDLLARSLDELTKPDELERWRDSLPVAPATRRRVYNVLAAALSNAHWLHGAGEPSAWRRVKRIEIPRAKRSRIFIPTDDELRALAREVRSRTLPLLVRAAVLTACRYSENSAALEVRDFDPDRGVLSLHVSKTGERDVLLVDAAVSSSETR